MCALFYVSAFMVACAVFLWYRKNNNVFWYGCARVRSVGLFELPHFNDLVKSVLSVF